MESDNALYIIYLPSSNNVYICLKLDFTVRKDKNELPSCGNLVDHISQQRQLEELQQESEENAQDFQPICFFTN